MFSAPTLVLQEDEGVWGRSRRRGRGRAIEGNGTAVLKLMPKPETGSG